MNLLEGKKILISGVANKQSLAWGIAKALHTAGAELAFACQDTNIRRIRKLLPQVETDFLLGCDVQDEASITRLFQTIGDTWNGKLDGFVHSIAYAQFEDLEGEFIRTKKEGFLIAHEVSAYSLIAMTRAARPLLKAANGSVITLSFGHPHRVMPNYNVMGAAKSSLESTALYLAYDLGKDHIRVNVISAGVVRTASAQAIKGLDFALAFLAENNVIGRNITAEDLGGPAIFLLSELSKGVTGIILHVDGGAAILPGAIPDD